MQVTRAIKDEYGNIVGILCVQLEKLYGSYSGTFCIGNSDSCFFKNVCKQNGTFEEADALCRYR